jgi:hypothetical protein
MPKMMPRPPVAKPLFLSGVLALAPSDGERILLSKTSLIEPLNRFESPSTALRAPSPPLGEKDGMRGFMGRVRVRGRFACILPL